MDHIGLKMINADEIMDRLAKKRGLTREEFERELQNDMREMTQCEEIAQKWGWLVLRIVRGDGGMYLDETSQGEAADVLRKLGWIVIYPDVSKWAKIKIFFRALF